MAEPQRPKSSTASLRHRVAVSIPSSGLREISCNDTHKLWKFWQ